jgi:putative oxidoreductase
LLRNILFGGESGLSVAANSGLTLLRGISKVPPGEGLVERAGTLGFPAPIVFALAAGLSEFLGGIFLALGFLTRISSFFIAVTMLTAILGVHAVDPYARKELALVYFFVAVAFTLQGAELSPYSRAGY